MGQSRLSFRSISAWAAVLLALSLAADAGAAQMGSTFTNSIGMEFVRIPAGSFLMGRAEDPPDPCAGGRPQVASGLALHDKGCDEEKPQHRVTISRPFYIGKYGVTQEQWCRVMGNNPAIFQSETAGTDWKRHPVENVSWQAAQAFCNRLNQKEDTNAYRLPTEAEWEYAARAGSSAERYGDLDRIAWYVGNSGARTNRVGTKEPNAWGIFDMLGNVWEWCFDWYDETYYAASPPADPRGPGEGAPGQGAFRVLRGGSWNSVAAAVRASRRDSASPGLQGRTIGFRCVRE